MKQFVLRKMVEVEVAVTAGLTVAVAAPAHSATLILNSGGKLTGATGVTIDGSSYDVEFLDGSCGSLFGACTTERFPFQTQASALLAAQSLVEQVYLNGAGGPFVGRPASTSGCSSASACYVMIPFTRRLTSADVSVAYAQNLAGLIDYEYSDYRAGLDSSDDPSATYARFSLSAATAAVPEPVSWGLMIVGFGAVGAAMRRRRQFAARLAGEQAPDTITLAVIHKVTKAGHRI